MGALQDGKRSAPVAKPRDEPFRWNAKDIQELSGKDRIEVTKSLTPGQRKSLIDALVVQLRSSRRIGDAASARELLKDANETRVKLIDLNGDGAPEIIAQASDDESCSPTGNCAFSVFLRSSSGYRIILERNAIQEFEVLPTRTNGFNDLVLGQHGSATESGLYIYRFAKGRYRKGPCYDVNWVRLVGDELQELKDPDITPCKR